MPDQISPIEKGPAEADIERVSGEVNRLKEMPEHKERPAMDLVRMAVAPSVNIPAPQKADSQLPGYMSTVKPAVKREVENLLEVAFEKGIDIALEEAQKSNSPFILDAFHDAVTGSLYEELKKRGVLD